MAHNFDTDEFLVLLLRLLKSELDDHFETDEFLVLLLRLLKSELNDHSY